jgi:hypothetical protein
MDTPAPPSKPAEFSFKSQAQTILKFVLKENTTFPSLEWLSLDLFLLPCTRTPDTVLCAFKVVYILLAVAREMKETERAALAKACKEELNARNNRRRVLHLSLSWALAVVKAIQQSATNGTLRDSTYTEVLQYHLCRSALRLMYTVVAMDHRGVSVCTESQFVGDSMWISLAARRVTRATWALHSLAYPWASHRELMHLKKNPHTPFPEFVDSCMWAGLWSASQTLDAQDVFLAQTVIMLRILVLVRKQSGSYANTDVLGFACRVLQQGHPPEAMQVVKRHCVDLVIGTLLRPDNHMRPVLDADLAHAMVVELLRACMPLGLTVYPQPEPEPEPEPVMAPALPGRNRTVVRIDPPPCSGNLFGQHEGHTWAKCMGIVGHLWHCMTSVHQHELENEFLSKLEAPIHVATMSNSLAMMCVILQAWTLAMEPFHRDKVVKVSSVIRLTVVTMDTLRTETLAPRQLTPCPGLLKCATETICRAVTLLCAVARESEHRLMTLLVTKVEHHLPGTLPVLQKSTRAPMARWKTGTERPRGVVAAILKHYTSTDAALLCSVDRYYLSSPFRIDHITVCEFFDQSAHVWHTHRQQEPPGVFLCQSAPVEDHDKWTKVDMLELHKEAAEAACGAFDGMGSL